MFGFLISGIVTKLIAGGLILGGVFAYHKCSVNKAFKKGHRQGKIELQNELNQKAEKIKAERKTRAKTYIEKSEKLINEIPKTKEMTKEKAKQIFEAIGIKEK